MEMDGAVNLWPLVNGVQTIFVGVVVVDAFCNSLDTASTNHHVSLHRIRISG